jgi:hypothetical protein
VNPPADRPTPPPLDASAAANSLRLLLNSASLGGDAKGSTPVVHLRQRLEQEDGAGWLEACLARPPFAPLADAARALIDGPVTLDELNALKERGKAGFAGSGARDERLASIAAYFLSIAAALKHHGRSITSQPLGELRTLLIDLAAAAAEPWSSLFSSAAFVEPQR